MKGLKTCNTPRPYLSWSQMSLWNRSPEEYKRVYIYGGERFCNGAMELGRKVAEGLENNGVIDDDDIARLAIFMPQSPSKEYEIKVEFQGIPLYGILDGFNPKCKRKIVRDNKTGTKYTQGTADKLGQLTFYAILVLAKYGELPYKIYIDWARTEKDKYGKFRLTGDIKTFETKRTMQDVLLFYAKMKRTWQEIQQMSKEEYTKIIK